MPFLFQLRNANTVDEVLAAARSYLQVWEQVLRRLPPGSRPVIERAEDIPQASRALALARRQLLDSGAVVGHELDMAARFFQVAAERVEELR